jgi:hypothetical protein
MAVYLSHCFLKIHLSVTPRSSLRCIEDPFHGDFSWTIPLMDVTGDITYQRSLNPQPPSARKTRGRVWIGGKCCRYPMDWAAES